MNTALSFSYLSLIRFILFTDQKDKFTGKIVFVIIVFLLGIYDRGEKSCSHAVNYQLPITNHPGGGKGRPVSRSGFIGCESISIKFIDAVKSAEPHESFAVFDDI
jgi:hypothetical protein